ncbi:lipopolysaccharide biosynthesis protein [Zunongwangia sp. H14]|uniref:lipopolysaccharide biosynthesis protein n=1 Tax=Zunongwangia sp. H14 TaxID=3240792 RepID=UPI0035642980
MRVTIEQISPYFTKSALKPIGQVLGSQMIGKALGFAISILLVRELSKADYAIYTVLLTIQGMLIPLSNSAIFIGFKKIGGEIWSDTSKISSLIRTAKHIAPIIIGIAFLLVGGYAAYILFEQEVEISRIIWFLLCLLLIVIPEVQTAFLRTAMLLQKEVSIVQISELVGHVVRFIGIAGILLFLNLDYVIAVIFLITSISAWSSYIYVKRKGKDLGLAEVSEINPDYKKTLIYYIRLNWHNSAFFAFKGQISIFLLGVFGTTDSLAEIGALARFSLIFTIISALFHNIYAPMFARNNNLERLKKMFVGAIMASLIICGIVLLAVAFFPEFFLWILGEGYQNLDYELLLMIIGGSIGFIIGIVHNVNLNKGWIKFTPLLEIPTDIGGILLGIFLFDITTLTGVLYMGILSGSITLLLYLSNSIAGLQKV